MNVLIGCMHVVESIERLNKIRAYILNNNSIGIMCYAVINAPLLLKNKKTVNSSSCRNMLCILSVSHGYKPISEMKRRNIVSRSSTILISDIDDSEKLFKDDKMILKKARYIHKYSDFVGYFNFK